jgi:nifR3 family TIM-barrel protein
MNNFWEKLKKPIIVLAPMAGITDASFRYLCGRFGADVVYGEMISAAGLYYDSEKTKELLDSYKKNGGAKFVVQLFGNNPAHFAKAVKIIEKRFKPDGIDINFGCPVPKIQKSGAGVKLFQNLELSHEVIRTVIAGTKLPVSVKVRIKAGRVSALDFVEKMKDLDIKAIMVHGRTLAQGFAGEVDYGSINRLKKKFKGVVLANGGINTPEDAEKMLKKTGADGIGVGQGAGGNPQIFSEIKNNFKNRSRSFVKKEARIIFNVALEHAKLMKKLKGAQGIIEMRKHLCWYAKGLDGAAELRKEFIKVLTIDEIKKIAKDYLRRR